MNIKEYPNNVQKTVQELVKRNTISRDAHEDKTLMNYLCTQKFDEDYIKSMINDRLQKEFD